MTVKAVARTHPHPLGRLGTSAVMAEEAEEAAYSGSCVTSAVMAEEAEEAKEAAYSERCATSIEEPPCSEETLASREGVRFRPRQKRRVLSLKAATSYWNVADQGRGHREAIGGPRIQAVGGATADERRDVGVAVGHLESTLSDTAGRGTVVAGVARRDPDKQRDRVVVGRAWVQPAGLRRRAGKGAGGDGVVASGTPVDDRGPALGSVRHRVAEPRSFCACHKGQRMEAGLAAGMAVDVAADAAGKDPAVAGKDHVVVERDPVDAAGTDAAGKDHVVGKDAVVGKYAVVAGKDHLFVAAGADAAGEDHVVGKGNVVAGKDPVDARRGPNAAGKDPVVAEKGAVV